MGRDVTGLRKANAVNVTRTVHVAPKALPEEAEEKNYDIGDHNSNGRAPDEKKQDVVAMKSTNHDEPDPDPEEKIITAETPDKMLSPQVKLASGSAVNGAIDANTPGLESDKQTSYISHTNGTGNNDSSVKCSPNSSDLHTPNSTKKLQPNSPLMSRKQLHPFDEEDNWSLASSTATSVKSRVTVPVAPRFTCVDRLQRRKEYYTKLEEKHKALEKEKLEYEARTKEEEEAAIKQLRKNMVVKAKPVPSFYREGPPPKVELKKLPVTRAKSPNLSRRKSFGDAVKSSREDKGGRATRHSVGVYTETRNNSPITPKTNKDQIAVRKLNGTNKLKVRKQQTKETVENTPHVKEQVNAAADVAVES